MFFQTLFISSSFFTAIDVNSIINQVIAGLILLLIGWAGHSIWTKRQKKQSTEGKERIQKTKSDFLKIAKTDAEIKDTEIPKDVPQKELQDLLELHKHEKGEFIKVNENALKSIFRKGYREEEIFSLELFHGLELLVIIINQYPFLPNEFKKPLTASIAWHRSGQSGKTKDLYTKFKTSLKLDTTEDRLFEELNGLNQNDRVINVVFPMLENLKQMKLSEEEKAQRFRAFYEGIRSVAFRKFIDNLSDSSMMYVGDKGKTHDEIIESCLHAIEIKLSSGFSEIIIEARGFYTNLATIIVGTVLANAKKSLALGSINISMHKFDEKREREKIQIILIKTDKISSIEKHYYIEKENKSFLLKENLLKKTKAVHALGKYYEKGGLNQIKEELREYNMALFEVENITLGGRGNLHTIIRLVMDTIKYYETWGRILIPTCMMSHSPNPNFHILLKEMGSVKSKPLHF